MLVYEVNACHAMVTTWERSGWSDWSPLVNQGKLTWAVGTMIDIGHDIHHGRGILYGTPYEILPKEFVIFESTLPPMKSELHM